MSEHLSHCHPVAHSSLLSQRRGYDTFIFWPSTPARLFMGLHTKRLGPVDCSQLTRWISAWDPDFVRAYGPVKICRVRLKEVMPLRYMAEPLESQLGLLDAIAPGDYGIFTGTILESTMIPAPSPHIVDRLPLDVETKQLVSGADAYVPDEDEGEDAINYDATKLNLNTMPTDMIATVKARDPLQTCIFTGETVKTVLSWIFPPALIHMVPSDIYGARLVESDYTVLSNTAFMRVDLAEHFLANNFGVDIDDNYRIRIFAEPTEDTPPLPDRLHLPSVANGAIDIFFKLHFRWCLGAKTRGGDISKDYPNNAIRAFEEMHCIGSDSDHETLLSNPVWNTVIGRAVLEDRLRSKLYGINDEREDASYDDDASSEKGSNCSTVEDA